MATVYVNIGSNLGNRLQNIDKAIEKIEHKFGSCRKSNLMESEPWGFDSINSFINIGIAFSSNLSPLDILHELQKIEKEISPYTHRDHKGNYIDREIDIDIMAIAGISMNTSELTLPHPHLYDRDFFLIPYQELKKNK